VVPPIAVNFGAGGLPSVPSWNETPSHSARPVVRPLAAPHPGEVLIAAPAGRGPAVRRPAGKFEVNPPGSA
jgi:hypothetical protein